MKKLLKRAVATTVATAIAGVTPLLMATPAGAAPTLQGVASVRTAGGAAALNSGDANDTFTLRLPAGAACTSDGLNGGRANTYMIPGNQDPATQLAFAGSGAVVGQSTGAGGTGTFKHNLFTVTNNPARAIPLGTGDGAVLGIPDLNFNVFPAGAVPSGVYNIGVACIDLDEANAVNNFWNQQITVTYPGGDAAGAQISWAVGAVPPAPTAVSAVAGDTQATVSFTAPTASPAVTGYTATATPQGGGAAVTQTGAASPITISGLTNLTTYDVTVVATNAVGNSAPSSPAVSVTPAEPARPPVTDLSVNTGTPGSSTVTASWTAPTGPAPIGYNIAVTGTPAFTGSVAHTGTDNTATISGLATGSYTVTVTPTHTSPAVGTPAAVSFNVVPSTVLIQEITVTRPVGALVLTQKCGTGLTAPTVGSVTGAADPAFSTYPYPDPDGDGVPNPTYPTYCGVSLGTAKLVTSGIGAGQFFRATGEIAEVTVVDTRDVDAGWSVNGTMGAFTAGPGKTFSGSQLGWTPAVASTSDAFTDSSGATYDQAATAGALVAPNTPNATGLSSGRPLATASAGSGLGIAVLEAGLDLLIPVTADNGVYRGLLTISAI